MIQFEKLRLHGFKSFVDRTEMEIGPGLTGIVGPNGCGKSNLVEALRWSMGESSIKRMRGGGGSMDDVIFNGTANRPARNVAEVSVLLSNNDGSAPAPFSDQPEIEVVRRIEREQGSAYRLNGKAARARDVHLLYADILSGANSPFLVSQGKVTDIIQAKPASRRVILEEAAGISGLHARRHEAELRLKATDANLKRLTDLFGGMETRFQALKRQARQAARYRTLSAQIRQLETAIACLEYVTAHDRLGEVRKAFADAESMVAANLLTVTQLTKTQNAQSADLPDLRQKEAAAGAVLQQQRVILQKLEDEKERLGQQLSEIAAQRQQAGLDRKDIDQTLQENSAALERMSAEETALSAHRGTEEDELAEKERRRDELKQQVAAREALYRQLTEAAAGDRARRQSLEQQITSDTHRLKAVNTRLDQLRETLAAKKADNKDAAEIEALRLSIAEGEKTRAALFAQKEGALKKQEDTAASVKKAEEEKRALDNQAAAMRNEIMALKSVLEIVSASDFAPILEDIRTEPGFETALACALGDLLMASLDTNAPVSWHAGIADAARLPALPAGCRPLKGHVSAPEALDAALSQIGYAGDEETGKKLWKSLAPGQSIVSAAGTCWRWDGLCTKASVSERHSAQIRHKNRFEALEKQYPAQEKAAEKAAESYEKAKEKAAAAHAHLDAVSRELAACERKLWEQGAQLTKRIEQQAGKQAELAKLEEALSLAGDDLKALAQTIEENQAERNKFDDPSLLLQQQKVDRTRAELDALREEYQNAAQGHESARQEQSRRHARLRAIGDERVNMQNRCIRAREKLKDLSEREESLETRLAEIKSRPAEIERALQEALTRISALEQDKIAATTALTSVEEALAETTRALKEAEGLLSKAREDRAHAHATIEERQRHIEQIVLRIREQFDLSPGELARQADLDPDNMPVLETLKAEREQAARDRDQIGPVNLQADQEIEALEKEMSTILTEKADLTEAIAELRQAIQTLNGEAKERLHAAFTLINGYFREIFEKLFSGGKAHLAMIESDDPMEAGLEIFAQPPGKTLQSLSLLSGGEQTLTAVALIFAMFMTNPAPICVMDEVDAPLDDANVDRFCDLLEEFADKGETRFLVITHHRLTMARMDRLYGVTMSERGVSQLVSVDLNQQFDFLEAAE